MIDVVRVYRSLRIVRLALGFCSALLLVACGAGASGAGGLEGKYFWQMGTTAGQGMTVELRADGTAVGTRPGRSAQAGTYRRDAEKVIVSLQGDGANITFTKEGDGNLATMFYGDEKAVFVKQ